MQLSKSDYLLFLKHPAWLWLKKHRKEVLPEPDAALQALFASGNRFERYAEQLFPGGRTLGWTTYSEYRELPKRTAEALADGVDTIFQGRFEHDRTTCIVDVLQRVSGNKFDLYEVKASTSAKPDHIPDLAFQVTVLEGAGLTIRNVGVVHVNRDYVRSGDLDVMSLSKITDVTDRVFERKRETANEIEQAIRTMSQDAMPDPSPRHAARGALQDWLDIYRLITPQWEDGSIYNMAGLQPDDVAILEDANVSSMGDIPRSFDLSKRQQRQVNAVRSGEPHIDRKAIRSFLAELSYPLYFLDYETFADVIPAFDGLRPYQQTPFQYSLHIMPAPNAPLEHREYLHTSNSNPVEPLVTRLREDIADQGNIIVWYAPFEGGRNEDMAAMAPEHASFLEGLNNRIVDLMDPFKKGWYVDQRFAGSASIKKVLPVLAPDLSYSDLAIGNGSAAQQAWIDVVLRANHPELRNEVLANLRKYCTLDTMAMVRIFKALQTHQKRSLLERVFGA